MRVALAVAGVVGINTGVLDLLAQDWNSAGAELVGGLVAIWVMRRQPKPEPFATTTELDTLPL